MSERMSFLFADLAGFTALTEREGDERAAEVALSFCDRVCELNAGHDAQDVKTIGDEAMVRVADPTEAVRLGLCIVEEVGPEHGFPAVRVGAHHGPAIERRRDWFGATVNTAARIVAEAGPGEVLVSGELRDAAGEAPGVRYEPRGERRLRNISRPVSLYRAHRATAP